MFKISGDRRSFSISWDENNNSFTLAKIAELAQAVWPEILPEEIAIHASSFIHNEGADIDQQMEVEPSEAYWKRTSSPKQGRHLGDEQKLRIRELLIKDVPTPADESIGDTVKKALNLSDADYAQMNDEIAAYVEEFFTRAAVGFDEKNMRFVD